MNKLLILISFFISSCGTITENFIYLNIKLIYINETDTPYTIKYGNGCGFDEGDKFSDVYLVPAHDTLVLHRTDPTYQGNGPSVNEINLYTSSCFISYIVDLESKCIRSPQGFDDILSNENRTKIDKNNYEFTYRFTDEKIGLGVDCDG